MLLSSVNSSHVKSECGVSLFKRTFIRVLHFKYASHLVLCLVLSYVLQPIGAPHWTLVFISQYPTVARSTSRSLLIDTCAPLHWDKNRSHWSDVIARIRCHFDMQRWLLVVWILSTERLLAWFPVWWCVVAVFPCRDSRLCVLFALYTFSTLLLSTIYYETSLDEWFALHLGKDNCWSVAD